MIHAVDRGPVRVLRLDRPPVNALHPELLSALADALRRAPQEGVRGLVLTGAPGIFSAGLDVPYLLSLQREGLLEALGTFFDAMEALAGSAVPVGAAISGHAPAGGAILALFCDWRVMAEGDFVIGLNEVQVGLPMPEVVGALMARTVGPRRAEELAATGRLLSPPAALEVGLVDELAEEPMVVERAAGWIEALLRLPSRAVAETRRTMRRDLLELVRRGRGADAERLAGEWYLPEVQGALRAMVARLAAKGARPRT